MLSFPVRWRNPFLQETTSAAPVSSCRSPRTLTRCRTLWTNGTIFKINKGVMEGKCKINKSVTDGRCGLPWLTARILEWKFFALFFFTMYSSTGSLAVRTLSSAALDRLSFCSREPTRQTTDSVFYLFVRQSEPRRGWAHENHQTLSWFLFWSVLILPSGCFRPPDHRGRTLCQRPLPAKLWSMTKHGGHKQDFFSI